MGPVENVEDCGYAADYDPNESTLQYLARKLNLKPESIVDPTEKLRGLLAEFNITESSTDIIRDIRDNRRP